jgi:hypothetical protein
MHDRVIWPEKYDPKTPAIYALHGRDDEVVPFTNSGELAAASGATLIEVGKDHRLAEPEPLAAMLKYVWGTPKQP